jgi:hypothetical protein
VSVDPVVVLLLVVWVGSFLAWVVGLIDGLRQPAEAYEAIGRSKIAVCLLLVLGGVIAAAYYLLSLRPKLRAAVRSRPAATPTREKVPLRRKDWGDPFDGE